MSNTAALWAGPFGESYTKRCRVNWKARIPFWQDVLQLRTGARSVFEVGCNAGWNLTAMKYADPLVQVYGCEVNDTAASQAERAGFRIGRGTALECLRHADNEYDLVSTAGVLIHIAPADLEATMHTIVKASADYVLAVEYAADQEEEVLYRGHAGALWRRPYGRLYEAMGLQLVKEWDAGEGFDRCTAWLLRRQS